MGFAGYYGGLLEWDAYLHFMFIPMGENKRHQLLIFFDNSSNLYNSGEIAKRIGFNDLSDEQYRSLTVDHESDFDAAWEILWGVFKDELGAKKSPDH